MIKSIPHIVRILRRSGLSKFFKKLFIVLRTEGFSGITSRLSRMSASGTVGAEWVRLFHQHDNNFYNNLRLSSRNWPHRPLISILMPVYNTPDSWLRQAIDSVISQTYENWELCIVNDASTEPHVRAILDDYQRVDARIIVLHHSKNENVSVASNAALAIAHGEYAALLDHDDILERHALHRVAQAILSAKPDMIYSDETLFSDGCAELIGHAFRPAFSEELLRSHAYIVHLVVFRTLLLRKIGGFDPALTISQDYDLILRVTEQAKVIVHIPETLYRWRTHSTSMGHEKQNEVMNVSREVLRRHLLRLNENASVEDGRIFNFFEVRYPINDGIKIGILIPTKNHGALVKQCIESITRTVSEKVNYEIIVIDHESDDPETLELFNEIKFKHRVLRFTGQFNFSLINNWAIQQLELDFTHFLLCNNDIEAVESGWLERMLELGQKPDIGIVGAKLYYPDKRTIQHAGVCVGMFRMAEHYGKFLDKELEDGRGLHPGYLGSLIANHEVSAVTAACMLISRDAFTWVNGFDESIAVGFGDVDLCLRVKEAGYRIIFCPGAELIHHESFTRGKSFDTTDPHPMDSAYFINRWKQYIHFGDPFYNPNLTLYNTFWHLKGPVEVIEETCIQNGWRTFKRQAVNSSVTCTAN